MAKESALMEAARALDTALEKFGGTAKEAEDAPLSSEKHLRRAGQHLTDIADAEQQLQPLIAALSNALSEARQRQQAQIARVAEKAKLIESRTHVFEALMQRLAALGTLGSEVNTFAQQKLEEGPSAFEEVQARVRSLAEEADKLHAAALKDEFSDVAQHAHTLREQLLAAERKIGKLMVQN